MTICSFFSFSLRLFVYKEMILACPTCAQIRIGLKRMRLRIYMKTYDVLKSKTYLLGLREITFTVNRIKRHRIIMLVGIFLLLHQQPEVLFPHRVFSFWFYTVEIKGVREQQQCRRVWVLMIFKRQYRIGASSSEPMLYNFIISLSGGFLLFSCETFVLSVSPEGFFSLYI